MDGSHGYSRIPDEDYKAAIDEFTRAARDVLGTCLNRYGMQVYIEPATEEMTHLAEQFGMKVRGKEVTIEPTPRFKRLMQ